MLKLYRKECMLTLVAFVLAAFLTHIYPIYFLFPELTQMQMFGFPAHYFLTLFIGWIVMMPLYWIYMGLSEKIDADISVTTIDTPASEEQKTPIFDTDEEIRVAPGGAK